MRVNLGGENGIKMECIPEARIKVCRRQQTARKTTLYSGQGRQRKESAVRNVSVPFEPSIYIGSIVLPTMGHSSFQLEKLKF